jgi:collagenase-like PrtC family protease
VKFAVGYQLAEPGEPSFVDIVADYREHIAEVYFPWGAMPSGRAALTHRRGYVDWDGQHRLEEDLADLRAMGVRLNLLFNANCYGALALSENLANQVSSVLEHLEERAGGVETVTTTSLAIAHAIKTRFPQVEVRASVNMRIGTVEQMRYVADLFDGFCVQRDYNRDLTHLRDVKAWADANGKRLSLLVNSGCLRLCPAQTFHDNLVAHEAQIDETINLPGFSPHVCWRLYRDRANWPAILQSTWIRPEDLHHYEGLVDVAKLATRMHANPRLVIDAYAGGRHRGNLLDLMEPGFSPAFAPQIVDNDRFPDDWFGRTSACDRHCEACGYCAEVMDRVLISAETAARQ